MAGEYQDGKRAGTKWATCRARPRQLRALAKAVGDDEVGTWVESACQPEDVAGSLWSAVYLGTGRDRQELHFFWKGVCEYAGCQPESIEAFDFAVGFVEGALEVWDKGEGDL